MPDSNDENDLVAAIRKFWNGHPIKRALSLDIQKTVHRDIFLK